MITKSLKGYSWLAGILAGLVYSTTTFTAHGESLEISILTTPEVNPANGPNARYSPVQHYLGKTFLICPDVKFRPWVTEIDDRTGKVIKVPLDNLADYTAAPDGHQRFTMGIDSDGYIHITGDMHGYPHNCNYIERYSGQTILYWRSNKPLDVSRGFTFSGGRGSASSLPDNGWSENTHFFNDRDGNLYLTSRVGAYQGGKLDGKGPNAAFGMYRYDHTRGLWSAIGGTCEYAVPGGSNFRTVLYWEHTWGFEAYYTFPEFDRQNRLHFAINGNTAHTEGNGVIYAYSDDLGVTWKKANGSVIPRLPIRAKDGDPNQGDLIERSKELGQDSGVNVDFEGRPHVNGRYMWDGQAWVKPTQNCGYIGPDGMMTFGGGAFFLRRSRHDQKGKEFWTPYDRVFSTSRFAAETTGAFYGCAVPNGMHYKNATKVHVCKVVFAPTESLIERGKAISSLGSANAALAFDTTVNSHWSAGNSIDSWLGYIPRSVKPVCRYSITASSNSAEADPKAWSLEGSMDGTNWVALDSRSDQLFHTRSQTKRYYVANASAQAQYRLKILDTRGGGARGVAISEFGLWTVDASNPPLAPIIFFSKSGNKKVWLSWTEPKNSASYSIKRSISPSGPYETIAANVIEAGDFCDETVENNQVYHYVVSALNSGGSSPHSNTVAIKPQAPNPRPPLLQIAKGENKRLVMSWLPLWPEATSYTVKRSKVSGGPYETIAKGVPGLTFTDLGLENNQSYYYVVSANKSNLESSDSNEVMGSPFQYVRIFHYTNIDHRDKGTATASGSNEDAKRAFNNFLNDKWLTFLNHKYPKIWLQYRFNDGIAWTVTRYQIRVAWDGADRDPKDWTFEGSNDGKEWMVLDTQKDQHFKERLAVNTYSIDNQSLYQYYRIQITKSQGSELCGFTELVLWADGEVYTKPLPHEPFPVARPILSLDR